MNVASDTNSSSRPTEASLLNSEPDRVPRRLRETRPGSQIARLAVRPGAHLRVLAEQPQQVGSIAGRLTSRPEVTWEAFERASKLARTDLGR